MKKFILILLSLYFLPCVLLADNAKPVPSASITIQNAVFSPYANIAEGVVFVPKIKNADKIRVWALSIKNEQGLIVREFLGRDFVPQKIVWDALDAKGKLVSDGAYSCRFLIRFKKNIVIKEKAGITIDSTYPFLSMKAADDVYFFNEPAGDFSKSVNIYLSAGDENAIDFEKSFIKVLSFKDKEIKSFKFKNKIPEVIVWDGRDDVYGNYLPKGNYKIIFTVADKAGNALNVSNEISVVPMPKEPPKPKEEKVEVKQEERGLVINLSSKVLFDTAKSALKPEAEKSLNEVAQILAVYHKNKVSIEGHTDSSGNKAKNEILSLERAQSVQDFFISRGVDPDRMQIAGHGSSKPVADNKTEKGREQNRRVEIVILKAEEGAKPQGANPQGAKPQGAEPQEAKPQEAKPQGTSSPETLSQGTISPETKSPEMKSPETKSPEMTSPQESEETEIYDEENPEGQNSDLEIALKE